MALMVVPNMGGLLTSSAGVRACASAITVSWVGCTACEPLLLLLLFFRCPNGVVIKLVRSCRAEDAAITRPNWPRWERPISDSGVEDSAAATCSSGDCCDCDCDCDCEATSVDADDAA